MCQNQPRPGSLSKVPLVGRNTPFCEGEGHWAGLIELYSGTRLNSTHTPPHDPAHMPVLCSLSRKAPGMCPGHSLLLRAPVPRGHWGQRANSEGDSFWLCCQPDESPSLSLSSGKGQDCGAEVRPGLHVVPHRPSLLAKGPAVSWWGPGAPTTWSCSAPVMFRPLCLEARGSSRASAEKRRSGGLQAPLDQVIIWALHR